MTNRQVLESEPQLFARVGSLPLLQTGFVYRTPPFLLSAHMACRRLRFRYNTTTMIVGQSSPPKSLLRTLLPQLILLAVIAAFYSLSLMELIPSPHKLNGILVELFKKNGLPLIVVCSFFENLVGANAYFPGAFTILTGMALTAGNPTQAGVTYLAIYIPAYGANVISYWLGRWRKSNEGAGVVSLNQQTKWRFWLTYWHPQLASITAFSSGVRGTISQRKFYLLAFFVSLTWSIFWAVIIYQFGLAANVAGYFGPMFIVYVLVWAAVDSWKFFSTKS